jgi:hypothetical protein
VWTTIVSHLQMHCRYVNSQTRATVGCIVTLRAFHFLNFLMDCFDVLFKCMPPVCNIVTYVTLVALWPHCFPQYPLHIQVNNSDVTI